MSKASAKEPSMDEILSSIRQIIADDDAGVTPAAPPPLDDLNPAPEPDASAELETPAEPEIPVEAEAPPEEALSLSAEQIVEEEPEVSDEDEDPMAAADLELAEVEEALSDDDNLVVPDLVEPEDISFGDDPEPIAEMMPEPIVEEPQPAPEPAMPDPNLSADIADELLEPATDEAVKATFSKLSHLALGSQNLTIENMIREMLRPMLKDWLDENLPSVVEKMVEKEIERISRGS